jgi:hypothetical protein
LYATVMVVAKPLSSLLGVRVVLLAIT